MLRLRPPKKSNSVIIALDHFWISRHELLALYIAERKEGRGFWDLDDHRHFRIFTDADMIQAFSDKHASFAEAVVSPIDVLVKIAGSDS